MKILLSLLMITSLYQHTLSQKTICNNIGDVVFVVDGSDSIRDADWIRLKHFVANLIDNFEIGPGAIHVGIIVYSSIVGDKIPLLPSKNKLILKTLANNVNHPKFGTNTAIGIEEARKMLSQQGRSNAKGIVVVITDGKSVNPKNTVKQANMAKEQGVSIISIGVGPNIHSEELNQIASGPNYESKVADFTALENTVSDTTNLICTYDTSIAASPNTTTTTTTPRT